MEMDIHTVPLLNQVSLIEIENLFFKRDLAKIAQQTRSHNHKTNTKEAKTTFQLNKSAIN